MMDSPNNDGGWVVKKEVDYSAKCDRKIAAATRLVAKGKLQKALDILMAFEKLTRNGYDLVSTSRVLVSVVQLCFYAEEWDLLNKYIIMLNNRRAQLKLAIIAMVEECCTFINRTPDKETKLKLIQSLRIVTGGKTHLEIEHAYLTQKLVQVIF